MATSSIFDPWALPKMPGAWILEAPSRLEIANPSSDPFALPKVPAVIDGLYSPLPFPSIRLLQFIRYEHSGDRTLLSFRLQAFSWNTKPSFFALSYTWGHPVLDNFEDDLSNAILCNGKRVSIGINLAEALNFFIEQRLGCTDWLWVDAICS